MKLYAESGENTSSKLSHSVLVLSRRKSTASRVGPVMLPVFGWHSGPSHSGADSAQSDPGHNAVLHPGVVAAQTSVVLPYFAASS